MVKSQDANLSLRSINASNIIESGRMTDRAQEADQNVTVVRKLSLGAGERMTNTLAQRLHEGLHSLHFRCSFAAAHDS